jgi:hypothetical protein
LCFLDKGEALSSTSSTMTSVFAASAWLPVLSAASADGVRRVFIFKVTLRARTESCFYAQDEPVDLLAVSLTDCSLSCDAGCGDFSLKIRRAML